MRWKGKTVWGLLLLVLAAASCAADSGGGPRPEGRGPGMGPEGDRMGAGQYDLNGDGKISRAEFAAVRTLCFLRLDANGDSALTREEIQRTLRQPPARWLEETFARLDESGDGAIDRGEFDRGSDRLFQFADVNRDGMLAGMEPVGLASALAGDLCQRLEGRGSPGGERPPEEPGGSFPGRRR